MRHASSVVVIGIFSAFIVYDLKRVNDGLRDELHHRHAGRLHRPVQRVPGAAVDPRHLRRQPRLGALREQGASPIQNGASGPVFVCLRSLSIEHGDALDVRRVREHVDRAGRRAAIAGPVHEQAGVARQRRRIAADVDDARGRPPAGDRRLRRRSASALAIANAPSRGGSISHSSALAERDQVVAADLEQVALGEAGPCRPGRSAPPRPRAPLDQRARCPRCRARARARRRQRQREVAEAAEPVDDDVARRGREQAQRARHQRAR